MYLWSQQSTLFCFGLVLMLITLILHPHPLLTLGFKTKLAGFITPYVI